MQSGLTQREVQIMTMIASGCTDEKIARTLVIEPRTLKTHINHVYAKFGVERRSDAIAHWGSGATWSAAVAAAAVADEPLPPAA